MQLYFGPLACSLATRISLYEAGASATYVEVDLKSKLTSEGKNFRDINPLGQVPALRVEDRIITENTAVLQFVADRHPDARLAPSGGIERARLHQWLGFIGTELHKGIFSILLDAKAPEPVKAYALEKELSRFTLLDEHLRTREFLLDSFSIADAYLFTVLSWTVVTPIDLAKYPALKQYVGRLRERPSVAKALAEERALYALEQARHAAS